MYNSVYQTFLSPQIKVSKTKRKNQVKSVTQSIAYRYANIHKKDTPNQRSK